MFPPDLLNIGPITLHWYGIALAAAFLLGLHLALRHARANDVSEDVISSICFWGLVCGIIGARLGYVISHPSEFSFGRPWEWIAIWQGGQVFFGGLAGGLAGASIGALRNKAPWRATADFLIPFLALGHAIGRLGCFAKGCCYGKVSGLPWAIRFPSHVNEDGYIVGSDVFLHHLSEGLVNRSDEWSQPVHPTQIYSMAALVGLYFFLRWMYKRRSFDGQVFAVYVILYGAWRFIVEFIRSEPKLALGLTAWQWSSIVIMATGLVPGLLFRRHNSVCIDRTDQTDQTDRNE